jgi:3-oxoacyl-[acyl-carrier protein] reductase
MNPCDVGWGNRLAIEAISQCMGVLTMELGVKDRVALVFGAAGGLGRAIAESLAREGCRLALADVNGAGLAKVQEAIEAFKTPALSLPWALADAGAIEPNLKRVEDQLGSLDILVNNTGGPTPSLAADTPIETWRQEFEAMVGPVIAITAAVLPSMRRRGWGRVITSASSGVVTPIPNLAVSNALRSALVGWSKTLAREVARDGVTVNVVAPGRIATARVRALDEARAAREGRTAEDVAARSAADIPIGRYGRPEEYGSVVAFLASVQASYVTGSLIRVDGGLIPSI